jgi:cell division protein FtsI/penicillin-binding protein 2
MIVAGAVRRRKTAAAALALVAAAPMLSGCFEEPSAHDAVRDFLVGWQTGDYRGAAARTDGDPKVVAKALEDVRLQLDAASFRFSVKGIKREGETSVADFEAEVDLGENNALWVYRNKLPLHVVDGQWVVRWSPSVLHPKLGAGQRFAVWPTSDGRQPIVDAHGDALQRAANIYVAAATPATLSDAEKERLCEQLAKVTGFAQDRLLSRIRSAPPNNLVPLVTFGRTRYGQLRSKLEAIEGVKIEVKQQPLAPDAPRQIVGMVSAVTPETEQQLGGPQRAGDAIGLGGLQKAYQDQLTSATSTSVITLDVKTGKEVAEVARQGSGRNNASVHTTIDIGVQKAAELAVTGSRPVALVAVKAGTGEILAVGTRDMHQEKDALAGKFPAGSAFSVIAADALLKTGLSAKQKLPCPPQRSVGGAQFQQAGTNAAGATTTFRGSFANGCVTALAALARRVDAPSLAASAASFGIGSPWQLPLKSFSGSMPTLTSDAARAKAIVGQNVKVSPLAMALVAAAVKSGTWHPPVLVTAPESPDPVADVVPAAQPDPIRLDAKRVASLRTLMRTGVTSGTAATANVNGEPVSGITSAAADNRSWFIGWQGDVAVSVLAEGADPAAIAGRFFHTVRTTS